MCTQNELSSQPKLALACDELAQLQQPFTWLAQLIVSLKQMMSFLLS